MNCASPTPPWFRLDRVASDSEARRAAFASSSGAHAEAAAGMQEGSVSDPSSPARVRRLSATEDEEGREPEDAKGAYHSDVRLTCPPCIESRCIALAEIYSPKTSGSSLSFPPRPTLQVEVVNEVVERLLGVRLPEKAFFGRRGEQLAALPLPQLKAQCGLWLEVCGPDYTRRFIEREPMLLTRHPSWLLQALERFSQLLLLEPAECLQFALKNTALVSVQGCWEEHAQH